VTIRQLLEMRSGIPDYTQAFGLLDGVEEDLLHRRARRWTAQQLLDIVADSDPDFPPGTRFAYSNTNYILLGEVITAVTGDPWDQALQQRVLTPLGLDQPFLAGDNEASQLAAGHADLDRDANRDSLGGLPYGSVLTMAGAAGALVADADGLTAFAQRLFRRGPLTPDTLAAMTDVDETGYERRYGLGVFVHQPDLRTTIVGHTGSIIGYSTLLWYAPDHDLAIAVLVNDATASPEDLAELLLRQMLPHTGGSI
jgi:D-alanyl-D-alanine carboxypeptidase